MKIFSKRQATAKSCQVVRLSDEMLKPQEDSAEMIALTEKNKVNDYLICNSKSVHESIPFPIF